MEVISIIMVEEGGNGMNMVKTANRPQIPSKYIRNSNGHFVCPHCNVIKEKQNTMLYHIEKKHDEKVRFECKQCAIPQKFLQKCTYLHHLAAIHPDSPHPSENEQNPYANVQHTCPSCAHTTHTKGNMLIHFARVHCETWIPGFVKNEACKGCSKTYASSTAYLHHAVQCFKNSATLDQLKMLSRIK